MTGMKYERIERYNNVICYLRKVCVDSIYICFKL